MDLTKNMRYLNKDMTLGVIFLNGNSFEPNKFCGEKFKRIKIITYTKTEDGQVLNHPTKKECYYDKELIETAQKVLELLSYSELKFWTPSTKTPMVITSDAIDTVMIIAPRIKNG